MFLLVVATGVLSYCAMVVHPTTTGFAPDSWSYYDLSQTVFTDFYRASVTRSFNERNGYSRSFPPLWPVVIAAANQVFRLGPAIGVAVAALLALFTIVPLTAIARACVPRRALAPFASVVMWFGVLWFPAYWQEVYFGGSIALAVLLLAAAAACLVQREFAVRPSLGAAAGVMLGLACLARFDSLAFSAVVVLACLAAPSVRIPVKAAILAAFLATVSPWVLYSAEHYGSVWASDHVEVVLSAVARRVNDYQPLTETIATSPADWLQRTGINTVTLGLAMIQAVGSHPILPLCVAVGGVASLLSRRREPGSPKRSLRTLVFLTAAAAVGLAPQVLSGIFDRRYFSFFGLLATSSAVCFLLSRAPGPRVIVAVGVSFLLVLSPFYIIEWVRQQSRGEQSLRLSAALQDQLETQYRGAIILADSLCFEAGAVTRIQTVCLPRDWEALTDDRKREFVRSLGVTHALAHGADGQFRVEPMRIDLPFRAR